MSCSYNQKKTSLSNHIVALSKSLDLFTAKYERLLYLGDFKVGMEDSSIKIFCSNSNLINMINMPICYKSPDKPTCIDLVLINCAGSFQNSCATETGLSDFHKMIVTVMKASSRKIEPRVINYRDAKGFSNERFKESFLENLKGKLSKNSGKSFRNFINTCNTVLDKQLAKKKKYFRSNQSHFMNKTLSKVIMLRTKLRTKFFKNRSNENKTNYVKQLNRCVSLLRKMNRVYYSNLDEKNTCDNKTFWKVVKPMLSKKIKSNEKMTLFENDEIIKTEKKELQKL